MKRCISIVCIVFLSCCLPVLAFGEIGDVKWSKLANGLSLGELYVSDTPLISAQVILLKADLSIFNPKVIRATEVTRKGSDIASLCQSVKAKICINASFFDEQGEALGIVISRGSLHKKLHNGGGTLTGVFQIASEKISIVHRKQFTPHGVSEAFQAGPRLISNGSPIKFRLAPTSYSRRSAVCTTSNNTLVFAIVTSSITGITLKQLQQILLIPELDCLDALNLDGGGSSQLYVSDELPGAKSNNKPIVISGRDNVPIVLGLFE